MLVMLACARMLVVALCAVLLATAPAVACPGDCDDDGTVDISELVRAVGIALGQATTDVCVAVDADDSGTVSINELIAAVNALIAGCPGGPTRTPPPTGTPSLTETPSENQPPLLPTASVYRTFPGFQIDVPLDPTDPEGGAVTCSADDLPPGAEFDGATNRLRWLPTDAQVGVFYVPFTCVDDASPAAAASGRLIFRVTELDDCTIATCDPATGCTTDLVPVDQPCCDGAPAVRVPEPVAGCPEGLVAYIGQNTNGFGRLQNCDVMRVRNFEQSGAEIHFDVEARCLNSDNRIGAASRMDSNAANHRMLFDVLSPRFLYAEEADGFARRRGYRFPVSGGGPFFDIEGAEANLTVTLTDQDNVRVTEKIRVRLTFTPRPDLPDVDPTPAATPTRTPAS